MAETPQPIEILQRDVDPKQIAAQYIEQELLKLFPDSSAAFRTEFHARADRLADSHELWPLLAGIAEGWKLNWVYRILTNSGLLWQLERVRIDDLTMTGVSPFLNPIIDEAQRRPSEFAKIWHKYENLPHADTFELKPESERLPIMAYEKNAHLAVFDGMHRLCAAALAGLGSIDVWVGRGQIAQTQINPATVLYVLATYNESKRRDDKTLDAIIEVCRMVMREYTNGRAAVERALMHWQGRDDMQDALAKTRKELGLS